MATIQAKTSHGQKYWYIVESRRVNGKPRPVVLAYLGKIENLLKRLAPDSSGGFCLKSYSHGLVSALYEKSRVLNIVNIIDTHSCSPRKYTAKKPIRNGLTVGETIVLAAIGRACRPCSKMGWAEWADSTSLGYLLKRDLSSLDSQHFWDHMDCIPEDSIEKIETEILQQAWKVFKPVTDTLLFDTTNFFTYIDTTNKRCTIAKRGKNKQKRIDLRQVGLALVVTKKDQLPLFHYTYEGNKNDLTTFTDVIEKIKKRMIDLGLPISKHTMVYDKGMNSKKNFQLIDSLDVHYVTSIKLLGQANLIQDFKTKATFIELNGEQLKVYKDTRKIMGKKRTAVIYLSENFKEGVLNGIMESLQKKSRELDEVAVKIKIAKRTLSRETREKQINRIIGKKFKSTIKWSIDATGDLNHWIDEQGLEQLKENLGIKILVTDRKSWSCAETIQAYAGQAAVEEEFRNMKNPMHLAFRPQFHWTNQKIKTHFFICVIAHLLSRLIYKEVDSKIDYEHTLGKLLEDLSSIRLGTYAKKEEKGKKTKVMPFYALEEAKTKDQQILINAFSIKP